MIPPVLPSTVAQYYVPTEYTVERSVRNWEELSGQAAVNVETRKRLLYRAALLAQTNARFEDTKTLTSEDRVYAFVVSNVQRTGRVKWEDYAVAPFNPDNLEPHPLTDAFYADLPPALSDATMLKSLQADLMNWIIQNASVRVYWNPQLKLRGEIGGSKRDFLVRVQGVARQQRDEEADTVASRYDKKLETLEERAQLKVQRLDDLRSELDARKREEMISGAETALQLLRGRSYYALSRTSRMRRYTTSTTDRVGLSEQQLAAVLQEMDQTEAEMEKALRAVEKKWSDIAADVQELALTPLKKNIHVDLFGIGWVPYWDVLVNGQPVILPASGQVDRPE
jgi:hypothetical protein